MGSYQKPRKFSFKKKTFWAELIRNAALADQKHGHDMYFHRVTQRGDTNSDRTREQMWYG